MPMRRNALSASSATHLYQQGASGGGNSGLSSLAAVEARLGNQLAHATAQHEAHVAAQMSGSGAAPAAMPTLPLSSGSAPLRPATLAANMVGQGSATQAGADLHALEWADQQFKRAGVNNMPAVDRAHTMPIQNLGQRGR